MFRDGFHPIDNIRNNLGNMRAHPIQPAMRFGAGALLGPLAGAALGRGFGAYNNMQFGNAASGLNDRMSGNDSRTNWGAPGDLPEISGPSGEIQRSPNGPTMQYGPDIGRGDNAAMVNALMGVRPGGGQAPGQANTWNMGQWFGQNNPTSSSQFVGNLLSGIPISGGRQQAQQAYMNSPQAGGNLGIGLSGGGNGPGMGGGQRFGNSFGYSGAGGGSGAGTWAGGGGMRTMWVNPPTGGGGIARGRGRENGVSPL